jgi:transcriptional regulator with PAS, ATPase and Fis domain
VTGETGTGKNVLAKQIHFSLAGPESPLVYTNCSSVPASLFESELFGYEKGAFTGAGAQKKGRVESADGGTLLLDEITEIPYEIQAKLLDFLQERKFYRVGGIKPISVKTRIIALTNKDLKEEIAAGRFRKDLFYRLNVIHFTIPPLCERGEDIRLICEYLVRTLGKKYNSPKLRISDEAMKVIRSYAWPGNVRELKNVLERACICADGATIGVESLILEETERVTAKLELKELLDDYEREVIIRRLAYFKGNRTKTAQDLGISIRNLQYKLEKYDSKN